MTCRALLLGLLLALPGVASPQAVGAACRQALVFGLDVSGSVDAREYRLQIEGLANALEHPEVRDALLALPTVPVRLAAYEWSGRGDVRLLFPWAEINDAADISALAAGLRGTRRESRTFATALGSALEYGAAMLSSQFGCWRRTLDISGDGKSNVGPHPREISHSDMGNLTINALVIGADARGDQDRRMVEIGELVSYFQAYVIKGPDAFVEVALGFEDYEPAMVRKLKRELQGVVIGSVAPQRQSP